MDRRFARLAWRWIVGLLPALLLAACAQKMAEQPKYRPLKESGFFADGRSARLLVAGTVPHGTHRENPYLLAEMSGRQGQAVRSSDSGEEQRDINNLPVPLTPELLERGRERFNIYCSVCHGLAGYGDGMVVARGFSAPPSFHSEQVRNYPASHFFDVITRGFGAMPSYAGQIAPEDRWAIIAYVRALQLSQRAHLDDLPPEARKRLEAEPGR